MLARLAPLLSGRDTEIDMIEREMEGGVVVIQPPEVNAQNVKGRVGRFASIGEVVDVRQLGPKPSVVPKA